MLTDIDTLDARDTTSVGQDLALDLLTSLHNELVRKVENKESAVLDSVDQIRVCVQVRREFDAREVLDVLVGSVDDIRQVLRSLA